MDPREPGSRGPQKEQVHLAEGGSEEVRERLSLERSSALEGPIGGPDRADEGGAFAQWVSARGDEQ